MTQSDSPAAISVLLQPHLPALAMTAALYEGTPALRRAGEAYLPRFPLEDPASWRRRLECAVTSGDFARAIHKIVGLLIEDGVDFSSELPPVFGEHWQDIDLAGNHGDRFVARALACALRDGVSFVLIDAPRDGGRPYWTLRERADVVNWRHERVNGVARLTQVTIRERVVAPAGAFADAVVSAYRRFRLAPAGVEFEVYREEREAHERSARYVLDDAGVLPLPDIPLVPLYANEPVDAFVAHSPLLELAHREVEWYQTYSDYKYNLHLAAVAILVARGLPEGETLRIGPSAVALLGEGQSLEYVEIAGSAIGAMRECLDRIRADMSELGVPVGDTRNRTATEAMQLHSLRTATLRDVAVSVRDTLEACLWWHLTWTGLPIDAVRQSVSVAPRLDQGGVTAQDMGVLTQARRDGEIDRLTYLEALLRAGLLPPGVKPMDVIERLGAEWEGSPEQ